MKKLKFVTGLFSGIVIGAFLSFIITCKSSPAPEKQQAPDSFTAIKGLDNFGGFVYKLNIDNVQYLVVSNGSDGGIAIIKHR